MTMDDSPEVRDLRIRAIAAESLAKAFILHFRNSENVKNTSFHRYWDIKSTAYSAIPLLTSDDHKLFDAITAQIDYLLRDVSQG